MYCHPIYNDILRCMFCQAGVTALMLASQGGHAAVVSALVEAGANVNIADNVSNV